MSHSTRGILYMLLATFLFAWMAVFVKLLPEIPVMEIILFRSVISLALCWVSLRRQGINLFGHRRPLLILRGLAGALALGMNFYLLQEIPLATASTLTYLAPITTTLIGIYFVGEKVSPLQLAFFALSFMGVLVVQGFDTRVSGFHLGIGVITSLMMGVAYNCVRKLSSSEHPLVIIFYFPLMALPIAGTASYFVWVQPQGWQWFYIVMVGVTTQLAQYFMTRAYQLAEISTVSIVNFTGIIFSIVLGLILFKEQFNLLTYGGMLLVLLGVVLNVLFKGGRWPRTERKNQASC